MSDLFSNTKGAINNMSIVSVISSLKPNQESFYGSKEGYDVIVFDNEGKIQGSGKQEEMIKVAEKHNWACAYLVPISFSKPVEE